MSVLIKDMTMPNKCGECDLKRVCKQRIYIECRPHDCPLIYVPQHGDLIDQDACRDDFANAVYATLAGDETNDRANIIIDEFDLLPVFIEAEEGEK